MKINPIYIGCFVVIVVLAIAVIIFRKESPIYTPPPDQDSHPPQTATTPSPTEYVRFSYDTTKAEKLLADYVRGNIKEEFLPEEIHVQQSLLTTGEIKGEDYQFGVNWITDEVVFNAALHYIKNTNDLRDVEVFIIPRNIQDTPVNANNSLALTRAYLKNMPETVNFDCGALNENVEYCEHFSTSYLGKNGYGLVRGKDDSGTDIAFIFSCFFPKNDLSYEKRTTCLLFR